jgi:hypothetical protein
MRINFISQNGVLLISCFLIVRASLRSIRLVGQEFWKVVIACAFIAVMVSVYIYDNNTKNTNKIKNWDREMTDDTINKANNKTRNSYVCDSNFYAKQQPNTKLGTKFPALYGTCSQNIVYLKPILILSCHLCVNLRSS